MGMSEGFFHSKVASQYLLIGNFLSGESVDNNDTREQALDENGLFYQVDDVYVGLSPSDGGTGKKMMRPRRK